MVSLWPPTELAEGYYYETIRENFTLSDGVRNLSIHYVNPLQHVEGMLMAYLPREKLLLEADLVDTDQPRPASPTRDQVSFHTAVTRLGLDVAQIVPVHGKPDRVGEFAAAIGKPRAGAAVTPASLPTATQSSPIDTDSSGHRFHRFHRLTRIVTAVAGRTRRPRRRDCP